MSDIDDFANVAEVEQNVINTANGMVIGDWPDEQHFGRTVLHKILLQIRVNWDYRLRLWPNRRRNHLPVVLALKGQLPELGVDVTPLVPAFLAFSDFRRGIRVLLDTKFDELGRWFEADVGSHTFLGWLLRLKIRKHRLRALLLEDSMGPVGLATDANGLFFFKTFNRGVLL